MFKINLKVMKIKLIFFGVITTLFISCSFGPSACECLDIYEYKHGLKSGRKCVEKFGGDIPDQYRGTYEYSEKMKSILRRECNR
jgi:hypothetical protein